MNVTTWRAGVLSALLVAGVPAQGAGAPAEGVETPPLAVRISAPAAVFVGEAFAVAIEVDYDAQWFAAHAVPLVRRATAVPFHVDVPWLDGDAPRVEVVAPADGADAVLVPVGARERAFVRTAGQPTTAPSTTEQRTTLRLELRVVAGASGPLALGGTAVRCAFATAFREHLLRGREPVDRREAHVAAAPVVVAVRALPEPAPPEFCGVVGEVQVSSRVEVAQVVVGEPFALVVQITGGADLTTMAAPRALQLEGFFVQGVVERPAAAGARQFAFDLLPVREAVTAVPPVTLTVFAPQRGDYMTIASSSVPLRVAAAPDTAALAPRVRELIAADRRARGLDGGVPWWLWLVGGVAGCAMVWSLRRFGAGRRRRAQLTQQAAVVRGLVDGEPAALLASFEQLAARCAPGAAGADVGEVVSFDLPQVRAALGEDVGRAVEALWHELDAARFGGPRPAAARVLALVEQLVARG